ncbi:phosphotransferase enzyme family protein [Maribellus maritimus]|uniref:phosphotransferase enzyme family protein n=1 Tax=Maribellus maritimus TaxID=2870838 RepID=UPI001EEA2160|nr:aminoglycoside phosphotransferase family protein [Maribellus maritimus]MCG6186706.1 aminoglycoside phosphotransferase family protein [Maribellus maritimus]
MSYPLFEIASQFSINGTVENIEPFGNGHINDTFRISIKETGLSDYILQRKNHYVFKDIAGMMENIIRVTDHIRKKLELRGVGETDKKVITHIQTKTGEYFSKDVEGNYWAVFLFVEGSQSVEKIENPEHAFLAGKGFGHFQQQLADLPGKPLNETIVDFHNIEFRYRNFRKALEVNFQNRISLTQKEIDFVLEHEEEMHTLIRAHRNNEIPSRITHNDTKINNILFDRDGQILCVIDLDTVMPGLVHFDFGDAIRTAACTTEEDETDLDKITLDLEIYRSFARGFLEETKSFLTKKEIELLPHSAKFMTFIMGLRFLTDYLDGDVYYKIKHADHNIERARAQFRLVSEISRKENEMKTIIREIV